MRSLAAHLREPDAHDRLPFHPACPICRQTRLTGQAPADELVSPRAKALVAAGVLAMSAAAPGAVAVAVAAAAHDQQQDGTASVGQSGAADSPDFDPGGDGTDLPETASAVPQTQAPADPGNDDTGPVDQTTATNPDDPAVDPGDGSDRTATAPATSTQPTTATTDASTAPTTAPTPAPPSTDTTAPAPSATPQATTPEVSPPPAAVPRAVRRASRSSRAARRSHKEVKATHGGRSGVSAAPVAPVAPPATAPVVPASAAAVSVAVSGHHTKPGDRTHTVLTGESLWTIATDLLGGDASTAKVAREVHRLWQLNHDRIGTGDPDLLRIGTTLELR